MSKSRRLRRAGVPIQAGVPFVGKRRPEKLEKRKDRILRKLARVIDQDLINNNGEEKV